MSINSALIIAMGLAIIAWSLSMIRGERKLAVGIGVGFLCVWIPLGFKLLLQ
jgi:hypothetical protein